MQNEGKWWTQEWNTHSADVELHRAGRIDVRQRAFDALGIQGPTGENLVDGVVGALHPREVPGSWRA